MVACFATGCKKHIGPETIDITMKVGNIYCEDGSIIDPINYKELGLTNAVGVIFWVNENSDVEDKAYIVSRFDANFYGNKQCHWSDTLISTGVSTSITQMDGAANTSTITTYEINNGGIFEAKDWSVKYNDQNCKNWYLPSTAQLTELFNNRQKIIDALVNCGGEDFSEVWYWTSTEDNDGSESNKYNAYIVSLIEGHIHAELKTNSHVVRPVKTIK